MTHIEIANIVNNIGDNMDKNSYNAYIEAKKPKTTKAKNLLLAFLVGGAICTISQLIFELYLYLKLTEDISYALTTMTLIVIGATLTGLGIYDKLGKFAGAGSAVPVTGFANSVVAPAMEFKSEGLVFGTAVKMFTIAGPVLICGTTISVVIGLTYYIIGLF